MESGEGGSGFSWNDRGGRFFQQMSGHEPFICCPRPESLGLLVSELLFFNQLVSLRGQRLQAGV